MATNKVNPHGTEYYMDGYLKENLDDMKRIIKKDWDFLIAVDGMEGAGKSVLTQQMADYCSEHPLQIEDICFNAEEFMERVRNAKPRQSVIFDEAFGGMTSQEHMTGINRALKRTLAEIRQKNLFIFIVMPSFFELMKYAAIHRSIALVHVETGKGYQRGYFRVWNKQRKTDLYLRGKKYYNYGVPCKFKGRFTNHYTVDETEYRKKKLASLTKYDGREQFKDRYMEWAANFVQNLHKQGYSQRKIAEMGTCSRSTVGRLLVYSKNNLNERGRK